MSHQSQRLLFSALYYGSILNINNLTSGGLLEFLLLLFNIAGYLTDITLNFAQSISGIVLVVDNNVAWNASSALEI